MNLLVMCSYILSAYIILLLVQNAIVWILGTKRNDATEYKNNEEF